MIFSPVLNFVDQSLLHILLDNYCFRTMFLNWQKEGFYIYGFPPFWTLTFWKVTYRHWDFITSTFCYMDTSTLQTYRHMEISSRWTFQHKDFLAWVQFDTRNFWHHGYFGKGYFGRWMFRHLTKQYVHFGTDILAPTFRHLC